MAKELLNAHRVLPQTLIDHSLVTGEGSEVNSFEIAVEFQATANEFLDAHLARTVSIQQIEQLMTLLRTKIHGPHVHVHFRLLELRAEFWPIDLARAIGVGLVEDAFHLLDHHPFLVILCSLHRRIQKNASDDVEEP